MVLSNIGTIVLSFPSTSTDSDSKSIILAPRNDRTTSSQVQMLSLANTISRLLAGPIADFVSPIASYLPNGERCFPRKHLISRMAFLVGACFILALTCFWMEVGVRSQAGVWVLRWLIIKLHTCRILTTCTVLGRALLMEPPSRSCKLPHAFLLS